MSSSATLGFESLGLGETTTVPKTSTRHRQRRSTEQEIKGQLSKPIPDEQSDQEGSQLNLLSKPSSEHSVERFADQSPGAVSAPGRQNTSIQYGKIWNSPQAQSVQGDLSVVKDSTSPKDQHIHETTSIRDAQSQGQFHLRPQAPPYVPRGPASNLQHMNSKSVETAQRLSLYTQATPIQLSRPIKSGPLSVVGAIGFRGISTLDSTSQNHSSPLNSVPARSKGQKGYNTDELIHLPAPIPKTDYRRRAFLSPTLLQSPQRLLLVLDLNGTLLYRTTRSTNYVPRPSLTNFLDYCFANHSVLIWSSATPRNVTRMCAKLFSAEQRGLLLGEWGRDTLDLTPKQYSKRVQVYKRLEKIWNCPELQKFHPAFDAGERWGQHNTVLIDDSAMKAAAQPYNHLEVPEFIGGGGSEGDGKRVLDQVMEMLEEIRKWSDVSASVRAQAVAKEGEMALKGGDVAMAAK